MNTARVALLGLSLLAVACSNLTQPETRLRAAATWKTGSIKLIPKSELSPLGGKLDEGRRLVVSNNPELITSPGILLSTGSNASGRGGSPTAVTKGTVYLFHLNQSGTDTTLQIVMTNPNNTPVKVTFKGSAYTDRSHPIIAGKAETGPSYAVAKDWNNNALPYSGSFSVASKKAASMASISFPSPSTIDGRFQFEATAGVYVYVVASTTSDPGQAIRLPFAGGTLYEETRNTYGRSAGVYQGDAWTGETKINLSSAAGYTGIAWNVSQKFGGGPQNQAPAGVMVLSKSSKNHYGGYGMRYAINFNLAATKSRQVRLHVGQFVPNPPSFNYSGPIKVTVDGTSTTTPVYLTKSALTAPVSGWFTVPPSGKTVKFEAHIPGLISGEGQILVEVK
jgi:hypothetical protein